MSSFSQVNEGPVIPNTKRTNANDAISVPVKDTQEKKDSLPSTSKGNKNLIDTKVVYSATDSIVLSRDSKMVYLYKNAKVEYGDITLEADYIEYDQENNFVYATGVIDSAGNLVGKPLFTEKSEKFDAKTIKYNFKTKKGFIEEVFTEEEDGFLHSELTKKMDDNSFLMKNGKYTTCNDPSHPHFYLSMSKAKVIPGEKIISGYSYLVMQDLPLKFLFIPFGYFPSSKEQSSGILVPKYGEERRRGFYLRDGGYYFGISDKMDLAITADIFSEGSWGTDLRYRFVKRYRFSSNLNVSYNEFEKGEKGLPDYIKSKDIKINWNHSQDPKANPNSKFSASVNYSTSSYEKYNSKTIEDLNTNTKSSSIQYSKSWPGSPFRLNAQLNHSQNNQTNNVNLTLPIITFNMDRKYPFRKEGSSGELKWYENIEVSYRSKLENRISTADSLLFNGTTFSDFQNGFQHNIPISTNIKILKYFNLSPQVEYTGILYTSYLGNRYYDYNYYDEKTKKYGATITDTINSLKYAQLVSPSVSLSVGPNIYGMYAFKNPNAKIVAVRHVITPSVGVSYRPDLGNMVDQYYGKYEMYSGGKLQEVEYSIFENGLYKFPAAPGQSGVVSVGLNNNLEMKIRSDKDTVTGTRKIKLIDGLRISSSYNIFADSMNWSPINISGNTTIFRDKVNINFGATVDPYAINSSGRKYNEYHWNVSEDQFLGKIGRLTNFNMSVDFRLNSTSAAGNESQNQAQGNDLRDEFGNPIEEPVIQQPIVGYVDFDVPWNITVGYNYNYSKPAFEKNITQTLRLSGDLSLTKKWKISFSTNYDITNKELSSTSLNIHRDLHCWEMTFSWIPIGRMQSYNFQINVKASTLKDFLKLPKKRTWQENL
jgi:lipopolysaccharide assembly outer membrane protein LptD (OstA)